MKAFGPAVAVLALAVPAVAAGGEADLGLRIAQNRCATCHLVEAAAPARGATSPNRSAPPFQVIALAYEPEDLEEALAEGIVVGHNAKGDPQMPEFALGAREASALVAYLRRLRAR